MKIEETKIYYHLKEKDSIYIKKIDLLIPEIEKLLNQIPSTFSNYTIHNINHSANVAEQMFSLLPETIDNYNELELYMMLLAAMLHDFGMVNSATWINIKNKLQDKLRKKHHINSKEQIEKLDYKYFDASNDGSGISFQRELALIAQSHGESVNWIKENLKEKQTFGIYDVNLQFIAFLLRLGDLLDFDPTRAPKVLFDYLTLPEDSKKEWQKQRAITNIKKIDDNGFVYFDGSCEIPELYRGLCNYFEDISKEIKIIKGEKFSENKYNLKIHAEVKNQIKKIGFDSADLQHKMDYLAISNLLMGDNLYPDKKCALRELLQNAIDACLLLKKLRNDDSYVPTIIIRIDGNKISIEDNGIGMAEGHINNYFLNIGHSYYSSDEFSKQGIDYAPISHYGIGFLSSFMLSEVVTVVTSYWKNQMERIEVDLRKDDKYVILRKNKNNMPWSGTKVILDYTGFKKIFENKKNIEEYIKETFLKPNIKIKIISNKNEKTISFSIIFLREVAFTDVSQYLNDVDCKFNKFFSPKIFSNKNILPFQNDYLLDDSICNNILDKEDLHNYCENTKSDYEITKLLDSKNYINYCEIYPLNSDAEYLYNQALEILEDEEGAWDYINKKDLQPEPFVIFVRNSENLEEYDYFEMLDSYTIRKNNDSIMTAIKALLSRTSTNTDCIGFIKKKGQIFYNGTLYSQLQFNIGLDYKNRLFVKNTNISNFSIRIPTILMGGFPFNFLINIKSKNCIPDVSRSKLKDEDCKKLGYAIGRAVYIDLLKSGKNGKKDLSETEKAFVKDFINKYYPFDKNNEYCKDIEL